MPSEMHDAFTPISTEVKTSYIRYVGLNEERYVERFGEICKI